MNWGAALGLRRRLGFALRALHPDKVGKVVRADERDLAGGEAREFAQARLIGAPLSAVELDHRSKKRTPFGAAPPPGSTSE